MKVLKPITCACSCSKSSRDAWSCMIVLARSRLYSSWWGRGRSMSRNSKISKRTGWQTKNSSIWHRKKRIEYSTKNLKQSNKMSPNIAINLADSGSRSLLLLLTTRYSMNSLLNSVALSISPLSASKWSKWDRSLVSILASTKYPSWTRMEDFTMIPMRVSHQSI